MKVYKITNLINNKVYIGATVRSLSKRKYKHVNDSKTRNAPINLAIRDYGVDLFRWEILKVCDSKEEMYEWEKYYIKYFSSMETGYNRTTGGIDCKTSEKSCNKMSISMSAKPSKVRELKCNIIV